ncbi:TPA: hypothetical protein OUI23_000147 [Pseudomonas aeruginosa]|nr:hypothetical protein [Pseudomonas aeruginosa]
MSKPDKEKKFVASNTYNPIITILRGKLSFVFISMPICRQSKSPSKALVMKIGHPAIPITQELPPDHAHTVSVNANAKLTPSPHFLLTGI